MYPFGPNSTSKPLAVTYDATVSGSTAVTLNTASTNIQVSAIDKGIFLKWDASASTSAFDGFIPANQTRVFAIPRGAITANFIEESATAKLVCIEA